MVDPAPPKARCPHVPGSWLSLQVSGVIFKALVQFAGRFDISANARDHDQE